MARKPPKPPRFKVGDAVFAPNGQPRIITSMRWSMAQNVRYWGWSLLTVHPDDPTCIGQGFEDGYISREVLPKQGE